LIVPAEWVLAVERAYASAAKVPPPPVKSTMRALAASGAVASRYLAVGTPRSFAIIGDDPEAALSAEAHRTWFELRDVRCTNAELAAALGGRVVTIAEALAADIVCIHQPIALSGPQLRRGTHVNALAPVTFDDDLEHIAKLYDDANGLTALAAGLIDGRQLDEITIFDCSDAPIAASALLHQRQS
jgi:ornithine cyclodeaminase/alanine dehydrogenase-like protein (mu-crystallin family)